MISSSRVGAYCLRRRPNGHRYGRRDPTPDVRSCLWSAQFQHFLVEQTPSGSTSALECSQLRASQASFAVPITEHELGVSVSTFRGPVKCLSEQTNPPASFRRRKTFEENNA